MRGYENWGTTHISRRVPLNHPFYPSPPLYKISIFMFDFSFRYLPKFGFNFSIFFFCISQCILKSIYLIFWIKDPNTCVRNKSWIQIQMFNLEDFASIRYLILKWSAKAESRWTSTLSFVPSCCVVYVKRVNQTSIIERVVNYIHDLQQILHSLKCKHKWKAYFEVLSPWLTPSLQKVSLSSTLNLPISLSTPHPSNSSFHNNKVVNNLPATSKSTTKEVEVKLSGPNRVLKQCHIQFAGKLCGLSRYSKMLFSKFSIWKSTSSIKPCWTSSSLRLRLNAKLVQKN